MDESSIRVDTLHDMMEGIEDMNEDDFIPPSKLRKSMEQPDLKSSLLSLIQQEV